MTKEQERETDLCICVSKFSSRFQRVLQIKTQRTDESMLITSQRRQDADGTKKRYWMLGLKNGGVQSVQDLWIEHAAWSDRGRKNSKFLGRIFQEHLLWCAQRATRNAHRCSRTCTLAQRPARQWRANGRT
jgi:hypothetical protein